MDNRVQVGDKVRLEVTTGSYAARINGCEGEVVAVRIGWVYPLLVRISSQHGLGEIFGEDFPALYHEVVVIEEGGQ